MIFTEVDWERWTLVVRDEQTGDSEQAQSSEEATALLTPPADARPGESYCFTFHWIGRADEGDYA